VADKNKTKKHQHEVVGFLGVGLDNQDGHHRLTRTEHFLLVGGSEETHERMQDLATRFGEALHDRGKSLRDTPVDDVVKILHDAARR